MDSYPVLTYREMTKGQKVLFMYRGFRIVHKYSVSNARVSAFNWVLNRQEFWHQMNKYHHYWKNFIPKED